MTFDFATIIEYGKRLFEAPWWLLSALFSFFTCVGLRRWQVFPNRLLPLTCMLMCAVLTVLAAPPGPVDAPTRAYRLTCFMAGGILGALVWGAHRGLIKPLEEKYPWLKKLLGGFVDDGTTTITKDDITNEKPNP